MNCGATFYTLDKSVEQGLLTEADLDKSLNKKNYVIKYVINYVILFHYGMSFLLNYLI